MKSSPFTTQQLLNMCTMAGRVPFDLTPDGRWLTISVHQKNSANDTVRESDFKNNPVPPECQRSRVLVLDTQSGAVIEPFPAGSVSWCGQWSPDGVQLAAYVQQEGAPCVGIWERESGIVKLLREARVTAFFGFEVPVWMPDGNSIIAKFPIVPVCTAEPENAPVPSSMPGTADSPTVTVFSYNPADNAQVAEGETRETTEPSEATVELGLIDIATGEVRRLVKGKQIRGWRVAPDGHAVALLRVSRFDKTLYTNLSELVVVPLDGEASPQVLATDIAQDYADAFSWSPDSRYLSYMSSRNDEPDRLFVVRSDGSEPPQDLTLNTKIQTADHYLPRWSEDSQYVYSLYGSTVREFGIEGSQRQIKVTRLPEHWKINSWLLSPMSNQLSTIPNANGEESLLALGYHTVSKRHNLIRVGLNDGQGELQVEFDHIARDWNFALELSRDGSACYLVTEASNQPPQVWQVGRDKKGKFRHAKRLFDLNPALKKVKMQPSRLIEWRNEAGQLTQGVLFVPPDYREGQCIPLLVYIYGDDLFSNRLHRFGVEYDATFDHAQWLASQGYAVLYPDMPMAGQDPLRQMPKLVLPAVNRIIELGIADPNRVGVMGHSYGGYNTLALLTQTTRFQAAMCHSLPGVNFTSEYGFVNDKGESTDIGYCESEQPQLHGTLWEKPQNYIENSALFYLDRVRTPVLLIAGTDDEANAAQAKEAFSALRHLKQRVELRLYHKEGHFPEAWSYPNILDQCESVGAWFGEFLKPEAPRDEKST